MTWTLDNIARGQYGLVDVSQLRQLGLDRKAVHRLVRSGRLIPVRERVYRLCGVAPSWHSTALAAVLAGGPQAVLSHHSAGVLWGLIDRAAWSGPLELTGPRQLRLAGVAAHRHVLMPGEATRHRLIRVTTVERTLFDLASTESAQTVGRLIDDALRRGLTTPRRIVRAVEGRPTTARRRLRTMKEALAERGITYDPGANDWEQAMDRMWDRLGLPPAVRQYRIDVGGGRWYRPDRAIVDARIAVDWNGFHHHGTRSGFDYDSDRRARLAAAGWYPLDFTSRNAPELICRTVEAVYAERCQQMGEKH